jgi:Secretion system C-terminal sorting domain
MKKVFCRSLVLALGIALVASAALAKRGGGLESYQREIVNGPRTWDLTPNGLMPASAALTTTELYSQKFDFGGSCNAGGWVKSDATVQIDQFWHVTDFATANETVDDSLEVLAGTKSLWCGAEAAPLGLTCGYLALPGYGNNWIQVFQTTACVPHNGTLDVSMMMEIDSEASYDATYLEYTTDCTGPTYTGWTTIDGDVNVWDNIQDAFTHVGAYPGLPSPIKVRLKFEADGGWSDEDALWDSHAGPIVIDNLDVEGLPTETFEAEALGAETTLSGNWQGYLIPGYGQHIALFSGLTLLQQDDCDKNLSCQWAAIENSLETYACGGFPLQTAVPKGNGEDQYVSNEITSPEITLIGTGSVVDFQVTVYHDLPIDNLVFYTFGAAGINAGGCLGVFRDRNFVYYGDTKNFVQIVWPIGDFVVGGPKFRVRLGAIDMCGVWCGVNGTGNCHSHAPLLDNVRVYRVDIFGPTFAGRSLEQFQDTFPTNGTDTGTGRADAAVSWQADASITNIPADSATMICLDPITRYPGEVGGDPITGDRSGLAQDLVLGGWQIYMWVRVIDSGVPQVAGPKFGVGLQDLPRNPFKDTQVADGKTWTRIRCDRANNAASRWRSDFNDALFEAGDVIEYFYGATSTSGLTSYCSGNDLTFVQSDKDVAASFASEFSILPSVPGAAGSDILYVDGMDGRGAQIYWDASFASMGESPDRYDIRAPSSGVGNHPGARVEDVITQLNGNYRKILFDCGNLTNIVSDGTQNDKSDDYAMINVFLANLGGTPGGVFIGGDDALENLAATAGGSAATFKSVYITYTLTSGFAKNAGYGVAPQVIGMPAGGGGQGAFAGDTWIAYGGCAGINDFDVVDPTGASVLQSTYGANAGDNGADISQNTGTARVLMSGYSFQFIKDDSESGEQDRNNHLRDILVYLNNTPDQPTDTKPVAVNRLEQNYPNPFNPSTTIAFALKERARVKIDVYNVAGQLVKTLVDETRDAGAYTNVNWNGTDSANQPVSSGVYFYKLTTNNFSQTKKMVLLK